MNSYNVESVVFENLSKGFYLADFFVIDVVTAGPTDVRVESQVEDV